MNFKNMENLIARTELEKPEEEEQEEEDVEPKAKRIITSKEELLFEITKLIEAYHPVSEPLSFNPFQFKIMNQNKLNFIETPEVKFITKNLKTFKDKRKEFHKVAELEHFSALSQADLGKIFQVDQKTIHNWMSSKDGEDSSKKP